MSFLPRLALPLAALLAACSPQPPGPPPAATAQTAGAAVELREVDIAVSAEAVVEAVHQSTVSSQIAGRIVDIRFDVGDRVEKGAVIVRIDERAASQALAASEAQLQSARSVLANARAQYERQRALLAQGFISQASLDRVEADYRTAESQVKAMLAGAGQAATERGFATVVAPYSGVVSARYVQLGEMATPGKALMTGFDPASLRVVASVSSTLAASIPPGAKVRVEVPSAGRWVEAKGFTLVPSTDPRTQSTQVRIELPEVAAGLLPGVFARANFVVGRETRLMAPRAAILRRSELTAVYVLGTDGPPQLRQVRLGEVSDEKGIEVLAGLRPGERVALDPVAAGLAPGKG